MDASITDAANLVDQAAKTRRSVRDFSPEPVDLQDVARILRLGTMAPSAWNLQPWRFVIVTDPAAKQVLQGAAYNQRQVGQAPVVAVIYSNMVEALGRVDDVMHPSMPPEAKAAMRGSIEGSFASMTPEQRDQWGKAQGNIALGYLLLLFEVHGYGTSPMLGFDPASVREILNLPDHATIPALLAIGKSASAHPGPPHRLPFEELARFIGDKV